MGQSRLAFEDCEDYREVVWWFLKGTTPLMSPVLDIGINVNGHGLSISFDYAPIEVEIIGSIPQGTLSDGPIEGWHRIEILPKADNSEELSLREIEDGAEYRLSARFCELDSKLAFMRRAMNEVS